MKPSFLDLTIRASLFVSAGTALSTINHVNSLLIQGALVGSAVCLFTTFLILSFNGWTVRVVKTK